MTLESSLSTRKKQLEYFLENAKTPIARAYWMGRLDELKKCKKLLDRRA